MVQAGEVTLAKRMIPAQIELVRANQTLADFGENVVKINGIIRGTEADVKETEQVIRTTKDLMGPQTEPSGRPAAPEADFDNFLRN